MCIINCSYELHHMLWFVDLSWFGLGQAHWERHCLVTAQSTWQNYSKQHTVGTWLHVLLVTAA